MKVVFFNKQRETFEVVENVTHLHIDKHLKKKSFVLYTNDGIKYYICTVYDLHKIDG